MAVDFANWSGLIRSRPVEVRPVATLDDVAAAVGEASANSWPIRVAGSKHSHSPVLHNDDGLVLLTDGLVGQPVVDAAAGTARIPAGTKLSDVGAPLWEAGFSLVNQGDVDVQSIAGLVGTGVHGTGQTLQSMSEAVVDATIVVGDGSVIRAADDPDVLEAARLNLGALGVITDINLALTPAYHLHETKWREPVDPVMERIEELIAATRHFEFFWYPGDDSIRAKSLASHPGPPDQMPDSEWEYIDRAHIVFPSQRAVEHTEMEYSIPRADGPECFAQVRALMQTKYTHIEWPVEYRTVASDNSWIGNASGRETISISVHQTIDEPHEEFFRACEEIFLSFDGRPHWGKRHYRGRSDFERMYGDGFAKFCAVRERLDPDGRFLNAHLKALLT